MQLVRNLNAQCPCCESRELETIQHTLFECEAFEEEREAFLARLYSVCPLARQLTDEYRCRLVMAHGGQPREIENPLYRYLIAISKLRSGILTEQEEGSKKLVPFLFRSSLIYLFVCLVRRCGDVTFLGCVVFYIIRG